MKTTRCIFYILLGSLIVFGGLGCHKNNATSERPQTLQDGVTQLQAALVSANPEVQSNFYSNVSYAIRYGNYARASSALQQIASDPSLNQQQAQAVSDVSNLLNQARANTTDSK